MCHRYDHYFYKALLALYEEETFNRLFANLLLYTWDYDQDLKLITKTGGDLVPVISFTLKIHK